MKILHVVTLISPDGAYGGPVRVAVNQAEVMRSFGHDVTIAAGARGYDTLPDRIGNVPVQLFPARTAVPGFGYAGTWAPTMRPWIAANAHEFDIAHVHLARDLVVVPAAFQLRRRHMPMVFQTHGMIRPGGHPLSAPVDRIWTSRLLRDAATVLALTEREENDLRGVGGDSVKVRLLPNGVPMPEIPPDADSKRDRVPEVLFMARLHERKRPEVFAEVALQLLSAGVRACFSVVGPPEGAETAVDAVVEQARARGFGEDALRREPPVPPERALDRMSRASVYVLPAVREPFAMTILEALTLEVPVVIGRDGGLAPFVQRHRCGVVVDGSVQSFAEAITELLSDLASARAMGERGRAAVEAELGIDGVGRELEQVYGAVLSGHRGSSA
ncbi:glycosyltransferase [Mycobacterium sp. MYCO198283]|uniref:glycosyltransferase n=1 Tax=Mycobacterium sp. MYCO198283 TaxID=2883505 RepID=UPI001E50E415|nr:glycosyltransferase [Mycobacterium sp. MYCO198283]MCG5431648.1 glycosyltransferase [Mycobacterium sp. MYCO198283]